MQLKLWNSPVDYKNANDNDGSLYGKWKAFHEANPSVYELFEHYAFEAIHAGFEHYGAQSVIERVRWDTSIKTQGDEFNFKINNNWTAFYARLFMENHPRYEGFFRTRKHKHGKAA